MVEHQKNERQVVVVGGGIAGMTAALKLAQRGYSVSIYEGQHVLGGNVGSFSKNVAKKGKEEPDEVWYDVYPHMFAAFYSNFWSLIEDDLGLVREKTFQPRSGVKVLGPDGKYTGMTDIDSVKGILKNLYEGPQPPADMIVSMYALLDLLSDPLHRKELLDDFSVAGFLASKAYMTERAALLHDYLLIVVWSVHSYGISAASYKDFFTFGLPTSSPMNWVLREDSYNSLIKPFTEELETLGVEIHTGCQVTEVIVHDDRRIHELRVQETTFDPISGLTELKEGTQEEGVRVDGQVVLAVGPKAMAHLAQKGPPTAKERKGLERYYRQVKKAYPDWVPEPLPEAEKREKTPRQLVEFMPELSEARQARAEPIAVANIYFKSKLPDIPSGHVSLGGSAMNLSFLDISQLWGSLQGANANTVLTVAASNYYGLPSSAETTLGRYRDLSAMVGALRKYLPQIELDNIDWDTSHFHTNMSDELFINDVASETWRPNSHDGRLPNLYLAGGYCMNEVGMATVEGAVITGIHAAKAIHEQNPNAGEDNPVVELTHKAYPDSAIHAMKLAMMPWAYQAKWWSSMTDVVKEVADQENPAKWGRELTSLWALPGHYAVDLWSTSVGLCTSLKDEFLKRF